MHFFSAHLLRLMEDEEIDAVFIQGQHIPLNLAFSLDTRMRFNRRLRSTLFSLFLLFVNLKHMVSANNDNNNNNE